MDVNKTDSLYHDYKSRWSDKYGYLRINTATENKTEEWDNHNQNLFTPEFFLMLELTIGLTHDQRLELRKRGGLVMTPHPGLIHRHPVAWKDRAKHDPISHDEYYGWCTNNLLSEDIYRNEMVLHHGLRTGYYYNDHFPYPGEVTPTHTARYTRQPSVVAWYKCMANKKASIYEIVWFFGAQLFAMLESRDEWNDKHLTFIRLEAPRLLHDKEPWWTKACRSVFRLYMHIRFNGYAEEIIGNYFRHNKSKGHPIHRLSKLFDKQGK